MWNLLTCKRIHGLRWILPVLRPPHRASTLLNSVLYCCWIITSTVCYCSLLSLCALHLSQQEDFSLTSESLQTQSSAAAWRAAGTAAAEGGEEEEEEEEETSSSVERLEDCHAGSHLEPNLLTSGTQPSHIVSREQKGTTVQLLCSATTWLQVTVIHSVNSLFPAVHWMSY